MLSDINSWWRAASWQVPKRYHDKWLTFRSVGFLLLVPCRLPLLLPNMPVPALLTWFSWILNTQIIQSRWFKEFASLCEWIFGHAQACSQNATWIRTYMGPSLGVEPISEDSTPGKREERRPPDERSCSQSQKNMQAIWKGFILFLESRWKG